MRLRQACELLIEARNKGNATDFYRAVALIEQGLTELRAVEVQCETTGRFRIDRVNGAIGERWELLDRKVTIGHFLAAMTADELHQLAGEAMLADGRRQGL